MPSASPYLHVLLTRWNDRRGDEQKEKSARLEHLTALRHAADDGAERLKRARRAGLIELESWSATGDVRWSERLHRIEDWIKEVSTLRGHNEAVETVLQSGIWFGALEQKTDAWSGQFNRRATHFEMRRQGFAIRLHRWLSIINERKAELKKFQEKEHPYAGPLLVSRARKQPDLIFVDEQSIEEMELSDLLQNLRRGMTHFLGRLLQGSQKLEQKAELQPALFEIRRRQLENRWKPTMDRWRLLREEILKDALVYESARRQLRFIRDTVRAMRCIEDVYRPHVPFWKKILDRLAPR